MIEKLRVWIKKWLGITELQRVVSRVEYEEKNRAKGYASLVRDFLNTKSAAKVLEKELMELKAAFLIGMDFNKNKPKSWAIVMIDGNPDFIRYVEFPKGPKQAKEIKDFLSKFAGAQMVVRDMNHKEQVEHFNNIGQEAAAYEAMEKLQNECDSDGVIGVDNQIRFVAPKPIEIKD